MSRFLLDTHVFLWAIAEPKMLSTRARNAITKLENELFVSAVTAYELSYKHRLGKLPAGDAIVNSFSRQIAHLDASEIDVSATHAVAAGQLGWSHRDPFDRLLAAQAMIEGMTLVTDDERLHGYEPLTTFW